MRKILALITLILSFFSSYGQVSIDSVVIHNAPVCNGSQAHFSIYTSGLTSGTQHVFKASIGPYVSLDTSTNSAASLSIPCSQADGNVIDVTVHDLSNTVLASSTIAVNYSSALMFTSSSSKDTICAGETTSLSAFVVNPPIPYTLYSYPLCSATSTQDDEIFLVRVGSDSNATNCSSTGGGASNGLPGSVNRLYNNYTSIVPPFHLQHGIVNSVQIGFSNCSGFAYSAGLAVFVDWNTNGIFDLPAERAIASTSIVPGAVSPNYNLYSHTLSVPTAVPNCTTLMRVVAVESQIGTSILPNQNYTWGETEDYLVTISGNQIPVPNQSISWYTQSGVYLGNNSTINVSPSQSTTYYAVHNMPGTYCNDTSYVHVTVKNTIPGYSLNTTTIPASCQNLNDGNISVTVAPPNNTLQYSWSHAPNLNQASSGNVGVGQYSVTISDTSGNCLTFYDTVTNTSTCGEICGYVVADINNNCAQDVGDGFVANQIVQLSPGGLTALTNSTGYYSFVGVPLGSYVVEAIPNLPLATPICNTIVTAAVSIANPIDSVYFYDSLAGTHDFYVTSHSTCLQFADTTVDRLYLTVGDLQTSSSAPMLVYVKLFDSTLFHHSNPAPTLISGDTLFYSVIPFFATQIHIFFDIDSGTAVGSKLPYMCGIYGYSGTDISLANNSLQDSLTVCYPFDPNDKVVYPKGQLTPGYIQSTDSVLTYTVRFQNVGNANATNVIIHDTLDANLEINSIVVLARSHSCELNLNSSNLAKFEFLNINLPDSATNLEASKGFITYRIKQKPGNVAGDVITNTAHIYFDYNPAIVTNTVVNTLYKSLQGSLAYVINNTTCNPPCGNGAVFTNTTFGVPPYMHTISPTCSAVVLTNNVFYNLPGGNYTVYSSDALGDSITYTALVNDPLDIITNLNILQGSSSNAYITVSGGTAPYTIVWTPGNQSGDTAFNLAAGIYTVTITDANGCQKQEVFSVDEPSGVSTIKLNRSLQVFPNPTTGILSLKSSEALGDIRIYNAIGQCVATHKCNADKQAVISIKDLPNAVYTLVTQSHAAINITKME
ncbi:MAG: hypothetical protein RL660_2152 [Bacteroidota bacterium]|jgi:uncharacterized repeat protein (TIGR01451 family)